MGSSRELTDDAYEGHTTYGRFYKPLDQSFCKSKLCKRTQYDSGYCKYHHDMRYYKKVLNSGG